jgi:hypothetical protein
MEKDYDLYGKIPTFHRNDFATPTSEVDFFQDLIDYLELPKDTEQITVCIHKATVDF